MLFHHVKWKRVVTGGHRRVGSEYRGSADLFSGFVERKSFLNEFALALQQLIDVFLPTFGLDPLMEISLGIYESRTNQRNSQIAGFLAMIARKDAETAGVNRKGSMQAEFG